MLHSHTHWLNSIYTAELLCESPKHETPVSTELLSHGPPQTGSPHGAVVQPPALSPHEIQPHSPQEHLPGSLASLFQSRTPKATVPISGEAAHFPFTPPGHLSPQPHIQTPLRRLSHTPTIHPSTGSWSLTHCFGNSSFTRPDPASWMRSLFQTPREFPFLLSHAALPGERPHSSLIFTGITSGFQGTTKSLQPELFAGETRSHLQPSPLYLL